MILNLSMPDGEDHRVSLYLMDYNYGLRSMHVRILRASDGVLLDERPVNDFGAGKYLSWRIRGDIRFELDCTDTTPVLSGLFVDPISSYQNWSRYYFPEPGSSGFKSGDPDGDGLSNMFEYAMGTSPVRPSILWSWSLNPGANEVEFKLALDRSAAEAIPVVEVSEDLLSWNSADTSGVVASRRFNATQEVLSFRAKLHGAAPSTFFRLRFETRERD